jgi:hypothetical protein
MVFEALLFILPTPNGLGSLCVLLQTVVLKTINTIVFCLVNIDHNFWVDILSKPVPGPLPSLGLELKAHPSSFLYLFLSSVLMEHYFYFPEFVDTNENDILGYA